MRGFGLDYYLGLIKERISEESRLFRDIKNNWDWYDIPGSLFGFDIFPSRYLFYPNPMTRKDKKSFTKYLPNIIKSNFDIIYNSRGMVLTNKNLRNPRLATILNN